MRDPDITGAYARLWEIGAPEITDDAEPNPARAFTKVDAS
jgi:hypothetical protein